MLKRKILILAILAALPALASAQYKAPWEVDTWTYGAPNRFVGSAPTRADVKSAQIPAPWEVDTWTYGAPNRFVGSDPAPADVKSAQIPPPWEVDTWTYGAPNRVADPAFSLAIPRAEQASTVATTIPVKLLGSPAQASAACHSVAFDQNTQSVTVTKGEIVRFVAKGKEFTWSFDGMATRFDLNAVAPTGTFDRQVFVSVRLRPEQQG